MAKSTIKKSLAADVNKFTETLIAVPLALNRSGTSVTANLGNYRRFGLVGIAWNGATLSYYTILINNEEAITATLLSGSDDLDFAMSGGTLTITNKSSKNYGRGFAIISAQN